MEIERFSGLKERLVQETKAIVAVKMAEHSVKLGEEQRNHLTIQHHLLNQMEVKDTRINELTLQVSTQAHSLSQLQTACHQYSSKLKEITSANTALLSQKKTLKHSQYELQHSLTKLQQQYQAHKQQSEAREARLVAEVTKWRTKVVESEQIAAQTLLTKESKAKLETERKDKSLRELTIVLEQGKREAEEGVRREEQLRSDLTERQQTINELRLEMDYLENATKRQRQKYEELTKGKEELQMELELAQSTILEQDRSLLRLRKELQVAAEREYYFQARREKITEVQQIASSKHLGEIKRLKSLLAMASEQVQEEREAREGFLNEMQFMQQQIARQVDQIALLFKDKAKLEIQAKTLQNQLTEMQGFKQELSAAQDIASQAKKRLQQVQVELEWMSHTVSTKLEETQTLKQNFAKEFALVEQRHAQQKQSLEQRIRLITHEFEKQQVAHYDMQSGAVERKSQVQDCRFQIKRLTVQTQRLQSEMEALANSLQSREKSVAVLQDQLAAVNERSAVQLKASAEKQMRIKEALELAQLQKECLVRVVHASMECISHPTRFVPLTESHMQPLVNYVNKVLSKHTPTSLKIIPSASQSPERTIRINDPIIPIFPTTDTKTDTQEMKMEQSKTMREISLLKIRSEKTHKDIDSVRKKLEAQTEQNARLRSQLKKMREEADSEGEWRDKQEIAAVASWKLVQSLSEQLSSLKAKMEAGEADLQKYQHHWKREEMERKRLAELVRQHQRQETEFQEKLVEMQRMIDRLQGEVTSKKLLVSMSNEQLSRAFTENEAALKQKDEQLNSLKVAHEEKMLEVVTKFQMQQKQEGSLRVSHASLANQLIHARSLHSKQEEAIKGLQIALQEAVHSREFLNTEHKLLLSLHADLGGKLEESERLSEKKSREIEKMRGQMSKQSLQVSRAEEESRLLKSENSGVSQLVLQLKQEVSALETQLEEYRFLVKAQNWPEK